MTAAERRWGQGALVVAAAALAYLPALGAGFVFDDHVLVEGSRLVRGPLWRVWLTTTTPDYWPLTWTAFWLEWRAFGESPLGYHLVNVALHAGVALLLWRALAALRVPGAWFAGLLFAVHPATVESVAWIAETKNTLSGALFLAALLAWLRFDERGGRRPYALALLLFALAALAKAAVVMLPLVLLGLALARRGRLGRRDLAATAPFFLVALAVGLVNLWFQAHNAMSGGWAARRGLGERVGGAGWALVTYLGNALLPVRQGFVHGPWPVGPDSPLYYLPALAVVVAAGALLALARRSAAARAIAWALGYHALMLLPVLGFVDIAYFAFGPVSNHLQYLALMGPVALAGAGAAALVRSPRLAPALVAGLVAALGGYTFARASDFRDDLSLWTAAVRRAPDSAVAHAMLSGVLAERGRPAEALEELLAAARASAEPAERHRYQGLALVLAGRPREAVAEAQAVLTADASPSARSDAGWMLAQAGEDAQALATFRALAREAPNASEYTYWVAALLARQGQLAQAADVLLAWCRDRPGNEELEQALAVTLVRLGRMDEARERAAVVAGAPPGDPRAEAQLAEWLAAGAPRRSR